MTYVVVSSSEIWSFSVYELVKSHIKDMEGTYLVGQFDMDYLLKEKLDFLFFDTHYLEEYKDRIRKSSQVKVKNLVCIALDEKPDKLLQNVTYLSRESSIAELEEIFSKDMSNSPSEYNFSERDGSILYLLKRGASNKEIGEKLYLSEKTIKNNLTRIYKILEVENRFEAIVKLNNMEKI